MNNNNAHLNRKKRNCEGQIILPFLPEWYCYLCRQNKLEKPLVKGYLGGKREKQPDKILNLHLTCTLFIPELHLFFSSQDGFEVYNVSKVQTEDYQCLLCQDSGNLKKGYSIQCKEDTCNNKIHLACINRARIYKQENEQKLLKCFTLCRLHARSNPQPHETTYDKLYNEIQNEWILVYKQLEEQEKQRLQQEKELQLQNIKGKNSQKHNNQNASQNTSNKMQKGKQMEQSSFKRSSIKHVNNQESIIEVSQVNQQSETSVIGNNSMITSTAAADINEESHSQLNQYSEIPQDSSHDTKKKRGRPPKNISAFTSRLSTAKQQPQQPEAVSSCGDKSEVVDATCKKVFTQSSQQIVAYKRDQQISSPFHSSIETLSKIDALNRDELVSTTDKKIMSNENTTDSQTADSYHENAYMQLFGLKLKAEDKQTTETIKATISTSNASPYQQSDHLSQLKRGQSTDEIIDATNSLQQRKSFRQETNLQNKKNDKQMNASNNKNILNRRGSSFDGLINQENGNISNFSSIYDNPFTKILIHQKLEEENQNKQQANNLQKYSLSKNENQEIEVEDEEQYLECGYPNYNDEKRQQNMENWWYKIDSEYFTSPQNPTSIIQELFSTLNIGQDYSQIPYKSSHKLQKQDHQKRKNQNSLSKYFIFYPKQMTIEQINEFCSTSIADLYLKKQKEFQDNDQFGYQMKEEDLHEEQNDDDEEIKSLAEDKQLLELLPSESTKQNELIQQNSKQNALLSTSKKDTQKLKKKQSSTKKEQSEIKEGKKSRSSKEKVDIDRTNNFDQLLLIKNLRDSNSCRENVQLNMLIVDCDDNQVEEEIDPIKEEEVDPVLSLQKVNNQDNLSQEIDEQKGLLLNSQEIKNVNANVSENGNMEVENDIIKVSQVLEENDQKIETKDEMVEKKEEEEEQVINDKNNTDNGYLMDKQDNEVKIEDNEAIIVDSLTKVKISSQLDENKNDDIVEDSQIKIENKGKLSEMNFSYHVNKMKNNLAYSQKEKQKYISYYQPEYVHEPLPLKINKKFSVLFHSVTGDGYLMVYDVNENSDIKRSMTAKNKSEYQICGSLTETNKLSSFLDLVKQITPPGIDENNRRRAIPTSDTAPQLMFSKLVHLNEDAMKQVIEEQIQLNHKFSDKLSSSNRRQNTDLIHGMDLRTIFFEKQWSLSQKRFTDWQSSIYKQIEEDKDIAYLRKQSTLIWDLLKLSQTKKSIILGYAEKEEYNTEIYFMMSSEDDQEKERHKIEKKKLNIPNKMPNTLLNTEDKNGSQLNNLSINNNENNEINIQEKQENLENGQGQAIDYENAGIKDCIEEAEKKEDQDNNVEGNQKQSESNYINGENNKMEEEENVEVNEKQKQDEQENRIQNDQNQANDKVQEMQTQNDNDVEQPQSIIADNVKTRRKSSLMKKNAAITNKKAEKQHQDTEQQECIKTENTGEKAPKQSINQSSEQKSKLRARKPLTSLQQQQPKLSSYMKSKQRQMNSSQSQQDINSNSRHASVKGSTIFETLRKVKGNPLAKRMKKNPQFKQKDQLETDCMICFSQKNTDNNPVVYCSDCQQSFHKICYGIEEVPEGKFFCDKCRIVKTLRYKERQQRETLQQRFCCPLCVETDLPIKLIYQRPSNLESANSKYSYGYYDEENRRHGNQDQRNQQFNQNEEYTRNIDRSISFEQIQTKLNNYGELWMHPFCLFTFNLAKFEDGEIILKSTNFPTPKNSIKHQKNKDHILSDSSISSDDIFKVVKCQICQKTHGHTVRCNSNECEEYFHPLCAFFQGLQCKLVENQQHNEIMANNNQKSSYNHNKSQKVNYDENNYFLNQNELNDKEQLQFEIKCKKHIQLERVKALKQGEKEINSNLGSSAEIQQIQQNLKQDIDYYLKQIFFRRFGVNYEKICSNFFYYEDFHSEVYSKTNIKVKFYNPYHDEYQSLSEILYFIQFGPQPKNQQNIAGKSHNICYNSNDELNYSKDQVDEEEFEWQMEQDYEDDDEEEYEEDEENGRVDENNGEDEEDDDDDDDENQLRNTEMKDEQELKMQDDYNERIYKQNGSMNVKQKIGESVLQPVQTYRKPSRFQRQQQQILQEEDQNQIKNQNKYFKNNQSQMFDQENLDQEQDFNQVNHQNQDGHTQNSPEQNSDIQPKNNVSKICQNVFDEYELEDDGIESSSIDNEEEEEEDGNIQLNNAQNEQDEQASSS